MQRGAACSWIRWLEFVGERARLRRVAINIVAQRRQQEVYRAMGGWRRIVVLRGIRFMLVARWWHERMQGSWEAWCHSLADSALQHDMAKREEEARRLAEEKQALACKVDSFKAQLYTKSEEAEAARQLLQTSRVAWEQVAEARQDKILSLAARRLLFSLLSAAVRTWRDRAKVFQQRRIKVLRMLLCLCVCVCVCVFTRTRTHTHTHTHTSVAA